MGRSRKKGQIINGWINLNKPVGVTSTQALGKVRWALDAKKAGHGGTLDPLASGVLPIALGEATKTVQFAQDALKTYEFTVTWGEQRSTDDAEGEAIKASDNRPALDDINAILSNYIGDIDQIPPQFSAIKIDGERAYDIARDGDVADIKTRTVYIEEFEIVRDLSCRSEPTSLMHQETQFRIICGKGTYIRSLARDMGQDLGCYGYISALKRTKVGAFDIKDAISLDFFDNLRDNSPHEEGTKAPPSHEDIVLPLQAILDDIPVLALKESEAISLKNGQDLTFIARPDIERLNQADIHWQDDEGDIALATHNDQPIAMVEINGAQIKSIRVFNL